LDNTIYDKPVMYLSYIGQYNKKHMLKFGESHDFVRRELKIKHKTTGKTSNKRELVTLNEVNDLDYCIDMMDDVIKNTVSPVEMEYKKQIKELKNEQKINLLKAENIHLKELNERLKENIRDLRNT